MNYKSILSLIFFIFCTTLHAQSVSYTRLISDIYVANNHRLTTDIQRVQFKKKMSFLKKELRPFKNHAYIITLSQKLLTTLLRSFSESHKVMIPMHYLHPMQITDCSDTEEADNVCVICKTNAVDLTEKKAGRVVFHASACGHEFCLTCLTTLYVYKQHYCPICRQPLFDESNTELIPFILNQKNYDTLLEQARLSRAKTERDMLISDEIMAHQLNNELNPLLAEAITSETSFSGNHSSRAQRSPHR